MKILAIGDFHGKLPKNLKKEAKNVDLIVALGDYTGLNEWRPLIMKQLKAKKEGKEVSSIEEMIGKKKYKDLLRRDFDAGKYILKNLNELNKPCLAIFGNGDWYKDTRTQYPKTYEPIIKNFRNIKEINMAKTRFKGIDIIGFGGYMDIDAYFNKKEWKGDNDKDMLSRLKRREKAKKKFFSLINESEKPEIFLLHYTPKGYFDIIQGGKKNPMTGKSAGIQFFTEAIKKYRPKLVFCGHMHEYQGAKKLGKSLIINPGEAARDRFAVVDTDNSRVKFFS